MREVVAQQLRRLQAMVAGDVETLGEILADKLTYVHTTGQVDTKENFLQTLRTGSLRYLSAQPDEVEINLYGGVAVLTGRSRMRIQIGHKADEFWIRFIDVYARLAGVWKQVAWQSTRLPDR